MKKKNHILAISIHQPYASQIAAGLKKYEFRKRRINHRGRLRICASKTNYFSFFEEYPLGCALCDVDIIDCIDISSIKSGDDQLHHLTAHWLQNEFAKGYIPRFAWVIGNVYPLDPYPVKGHRCFFYLPLK